MMANVNKLPTENDVAIFEMLEDLIGSIYIEMKEFSKKKPDGVLNAFKVKNVNRVLIQLKDFLENQPTSTYLDLLDDQSLPTNSDAILIVSQYKASMQNYRAKYTNVYGEWTTQEHPTGNTIL